MYCTFQPIGTILLSFIILGAVITLSEGLGAVLVIIGLVVTVTGQQWEKDTNKKNNNSSKFGSDEGASDSDSQEETEEFYLDVGFRDVRSVSGNAANPLTERLTAGFAPVPTSEPSSETSYLRL